MSDRDFVVLPRDLLFQFFGEVALPAEGDCAPMASRIIEWVEQHDLSEAVITPRPDDVVVIDGKRWRYDPNQAVEWATSDGTASGIDCTLVPVEDTDE